MQSMATAIPLEASTVEALDAAVASGRFSSRDVAIRTALHIVEETDSEHLEPPLTPEEIAGIERGLADIAAGRVYDLDEVFDELERRCQEEQ